MRIAALNLFGEIVGGLESYLSGLSVELKARGHEFALITQKNAQPGKPQIPFSKSWSLSRSSDEELIQGVKAWQPDLVWFHSFENLTVAQQLLQLAPSALSLHNYDALCISGTRTHFFPQPSPCGKKFGASCLGHFFPRRCGGLSPITMFNDFRRHSALNALTKTIERVFVHADSVEQLLRSDGFEESRIHKVNFGPKYQERPIIDRASDSLNLLFLGRMVSVKGGQHLLNAVPYLRKNFSGQINVTFLGEGPEKDPWEKKGQELSQRHEGVQIQFPGWLGEEEKEELLKNAHLLVVPSVWPEPFGLVGLEAAQWGVPSIAFPIGGIPTWLRDGRNGHWAQLSGHFGNSLARAILRATKDPDHYRALQQGARDTAKEKTLSHHVDELLLKLSPLRENLSAAR